MKKTLKVGGNTLTILFDSKKFASLCSDITSRNKSLPKVCFSRGRSNLLGRYRPYTNTILVYLEYYIRRSDHWFPYLKDGITRTLLHEIYHWSVARPLFAWLHIFLLTGGILLGVWAGLLNLTIPVFFCPSVRLHPSLGAAIAGILSVVYVYRKTRKEEKEVDIYGYGAYDSLRETIRSCIDIKREKS